MVPTKLNPAMTYSQFPENVGNKAGIENEIKIAEVLQKRPKTKHFGRASTFKN